MNIENANIGPLEIREYLSLDCHYGLDSDMNCLAGISIHSILTELITNVRT